MVARPPDRLSGRKDRAIGPSLLRDGPALQEGHGRRRDRPVVRQVHRRPQAVSRPDERGSEQAAGGLPFQRLRRKALHKKAYQRDDRKRFQVRHEQGGVHRAMGGVLALLVQAGPFLRPAARHVRHAPDSRARPGLPSVLEAEGGNEGAVLQRLPTNPRAT